MKGANMKVQPQAQHWARASQRITLHLQEPLSVSVWQPA